MIFDNDAEAWEELGDDFVEDGGIIFRKDENKIPSDEQAAAIDYLCDEWDYGYDHIRD